MAQGRLLKTVRYPLEEVIRILAARALGGENGSFQVTTSYSMQNNAIIEFVLEVREAPKAEIA